MERPPAPTSWMARIGFASPRTAQCEMTSCARRWISGVAALHRIEVELGRVGAGRHRARGAAAHPDPHAGAAELHEQRSGGKLDLVRLRGRDGPEPAGDHDRLVEPAALAADGLLVDAEIAAERGTAELVVEGGAAERAVDHDLQRARDVRRLPVGVGLPRLDGRRRAVDRRQVQVRHREPREPGLRPRAAAGRAFVPDLAARTRRGAGERRDRGRVVVRLDLHQDVRGVGARRVARRVGVALRPEALDGAAFHHGSVVAVGDDRPVRRRGFRVPDHLEHRQRLRLAVDRERGVEDLVAAVLAVGLREHRELDVGRRAAECAEGVSQIGQLVVGEREAEACVGLRERGAVVVDRHRVHRLGVLRVEQVRERAAVGEHALGHPVVEHRRERGELVGVERGRASEETARRRERELADALDPPDRQRAVARDVGRLRRPRRHGPEARRDDQRRVAGRGCRGRFAVGEQGRDASEVAGRHRPGIRRTGHDVQPARRHGVDSRDNGSETCEQRRGAEGRQCQAAFEDVQVVQGACRTRQNPRF